MNELEQKVIQLEKDLKIWKNTAMNLDNKLKEAEKQVEDYKRKIESIKLLANLL